MARWGRLLTAMVTPFDGDGRLDVDGAVRLARWLAEHGSDGLVVCGTTGESPVLTDDEKVELWRAVVDAVTVPVLAGSTTYDTSHSIELTKRAESCGVAGILAVTPYYNRPSQDGLEAHFKAVASATTLPVMLYDIPIRTGRKIEQATMLRIAHDAPNVVAVKDAAGNPAESARLLREAPSGFELYSGDDNHTLPFLSIGGVGLVSVAAHWCGEHLAEMMRSFCDGDVARAAAINRRLLPSYAFETSDANPNPVPAKAMLRLLGLPGGSCRLPHVEHDSGALRAAAQAIIDDLGITVS